MIRLIQSLILFVAISGNLRADFIPPQPSSPEALEFKFLTVGLGTDLDASYGHTMIRVIDHSNNLDYVANWGMFDFDDPFFAVKFYLGKTIYRMGFSNFKNTLRHYENVERRPVWQYDLNLTNDQKTKLLNKIIWNAQPENVHYLYQYFLNNCATAPRDYLNEIYGNKIRERFAREKVDRTFRYYVFNHLSYNPLVGFGLDILFSSFNDQPMNAWEEMFYPIKLSEYLETMPVTEDAQKVFPNGNLLSNKVTLVDLPEPPFPPTNPYYYFIAFFFPLLGLSFLLRQHKIQSIFFGITSFTWGAIAGFFGFTHIFVWLFSAHFTAYHNVNLFLFWPTDFVFLWYGIKLILSSVRNRPFIQPRGSAIFAWSHLVSCALYLVLWLVGAFEQNVLRVLVFVVPVHILYYVYILMKSPKIFSRRDP